MPANVSISVIDPLTPAFQHMKTMLFRPFDLGRWFTIGFCAWLAALGHGGGGTNFAGTNKINEAQDRLPQAKQWVTDNLNWLIPTIIAAAVLGLALWILVVWLSSRGQFMFLHCVARNRAEVRVPWSTYATHGNSLCKFRLVLFFVGAAVLILPAALLAVLIYSMVSSNSAPPGRVFGATCLGLAVLLIGCSLVIVSKMTKDFVVPIMALRHSKCLAAWQEFVALSQGHLGSFALYLLFSFVLNAGVGVLVICLIALTCCIAACPLSIPYVGTVLLLPVPVFFRAYALYLLAQFGAEYNLMAPAAPSASGPSLT